MNSSQALGHALSTYRAWKLAQKLSTPSPVLIDGFGLDIPTVVAVARQSRLAPSTVAIDPDPAIRDRLDQSVQALKRYLDNDWTVYGVNTGFGGSADARTDGLFQLQLSCLQHTQSGIIADADKSGRWDDADQPHIFHSTWARGAMLVRANQNLRGHSAVRYEVIQRLLDVLNAGIVPLIPLRGTISASGDLMPLSYIAGTIAGVPDVFTKCRRPGNNGDEVVTLAAPAALREFGLEPVTLGPKEALGLINGTAPSAALASLVIFDAQNLAVLCQVLTAFTAECLAGNVDWTSEFIHHVRPHPGQVEAAANIRGFLAGSKYVKGLTEKTRAADGLWQDRYSTRTAPQWIGPYLEDLALAARQVETELNSTSDNPLIQVLPGDPETGAPAVTEVYSGGNFQAVALTSAMDKTRLALVMLGRMLYSQATELINPATNHGLDANLCWGDLDRSFTLKGVDVNVAAYTAELASLAHPVSSHVQVAEMGNQGINSMAFASARRTAEAVDILCHIIACHIYACCQAIELRTAHEVFLGMVADGSTLRDVAAENFLPEDSVANLAGIIRATWEKENSIPWPDRCTKAADALAAPLISQICTHAPEEHRASLLTAIPETTRRISSVMRALLESLTPRTFFSWRPVETAEQATDLSRTVVEPALGAGTRPLYAFVRRELAVLPSAGLGDALESTEERPVKTIGSGVSAIYESLRSGRLFEAAVMTADMGRMVEEDMNWFSDEA